MNEGRLDLDTDEAGPSPLDGVIAGQRDGSNLGAKAREFLERLVEGWSDGRVVLLGREIAKYAELDPIEPAGLRRGIPASGATAGLRAKWVEPASTLSSIAASSTVRVNGPT